MMLSGSEKIRITRFLIGVLMFPSGMHSELARAQQAKTTFTVADEIGLTHFGDPYTGQADQHYREHRRPYR